MRGGYGAVNDGFEHDDASQRNGHAVHAVVGAHNPPQHSSDKIRAALRKVASEIATLQAGEVAEPGPRYFRWRVFGVVVFAGLGTLMYIDPSQAEGETQWQSTGYPSVGGYYAIGSACLSNAAINTLAIIKMHEGLGGGGGHSKKVWLAATAVGAAVLLSYMGLDAMGEPSQGGEVKIFFKTFTAGSPGAWGASLAQVTFNLPQQVFGAGNMIEKVRARGRQIPWVGGIVYEAQQRTANAMELFLEKIGDEKDPHQAISVLPTNTGPDALFAAICRYLIKTHGINDVSRLTESQTIQWLRTGLWLNVLYTRIPFVKKGFQAARNIPGIRQSYEGALVVAAALTALNLFGSIGFAWAGLDVILALPVLFSYLALRQYQTTLKILLFAGMFIASYSGTSAGAATREALPDSPFFDPVVETMGSSFGANAPLTIRALVLISLILVARYGDSQTKQLANVGRVIRQELQVKIAASHPAAFGQFVNSLSDAHQQTLFEMLIEYERPVQRQAFINRLTTAFNPVNVMFGAKRADGTLGADATTPLMGEPDISNADSWWSSAGAFLKRYNPVPLPCASPPCLRSSGYIDV